MVDVATIKTWFRGWIMTHRLIHGAVQWPNEREEEGRRIYPGWISEFARYNVTQAEAEEATRRMQSAPPVRFEKHLGAVIELCKLVREEWRGRDREHARTHPDEPAPEPLSDDDLAHWKQQATELSPMNPMWRVAHAILAEETGEVYLPPTGPSAPLITLWGQWAARAKSPLRELGSHALDTVANFPAGAHARPPATSSGRNP